MIKIIIYDKKNRLFCKMYVKYHEEEKYYICIIKNIKK